MSKKTLLNETQIRRFMKLADLGATQKFQSLREMGDYPGAVASLRVAIELKPDFAAAHAGLGSALSGMRHFPGAVFRPKLPRNT